MLEALQDNVVSAKFPHRIIELVEPYCSGQFGQRGGMQSFSDFETKMLQILQNDIGTAAERQRGKNYSYPEVAKIQQALEQYLAKIVHVYRWLRSSAFCQTGGFHRSHLPEQAQQLPTNQQQASQTSKTMNTILPTTDVFCSAMVASCGAMPRQCPWPLPSVITMPFMRLPASG